MRARLGRISAAVALLAVAGGAGATQSARGKDPAQGAAELRQRVAAIEAQEHSVLLELYALESRLERARGRLAALRERSAALAAERNSVAARLAAARKTVAASERFLALRLRTLYEEGETDPLEILLGSESLGDAIDGLDGLHFAAQQDNEIIERTLVARSRLAKLARTVDARRTQIERLAEEVAGRAAELEGAQAARRGYLAQLASERGLNLSRIGALEQQARSARQRADRLAVPTAVAQVAPVPGSADEAPAPAEEQDDGEGRTMRIVATAYALPGRTTTGIPVGWGVVAVDPSVIPLGTRMTIPGYGEGIAADVGPAVLGAKIDLWMPTRSAALRWGVRTVTITLHG